MSCRAEKIFKLLAEKSSENKPVESENLQNHPITNDEPFVENSPNLPGPSGILRRVNDSGKDFADSDWEDFSSDESIKEKTYELSSNEETSDEDVFTSNIPDSDTHTDTPSRPASVNSDQGNDLSDNYSDSESWKDIKSSFLDFNLYNEQCTLDPEINNQTIKKPIDIFERFINGEIIETIVLETNRYASQQICGRHSSKSRIKSWTNTNKNEIRQLLGIAISMGLTQVPAINLYWSKDPLFYNKFISSNFTRDRFLPILRFLHFSDNENADPTNRLNKMDSLISILLRNYQKVLSPGRVLVIDESMVPIRGRLSFRQYTPNKTHRYGVKLYKLCTSSGYTYNLKIYAGKGNTKPELGHSQSIVLQLLEDINPKDGRILYTDNYYSGIPLVQKLLEKKYYIVELLRSNRKGDPKYFTKKIKKGEVIGKERRKVKIIKWEDKRPVFMITTHPAHNATLVPTGKNNTIRN